tara:strand:- start:368 stop:550 length:183 start_codon:yes stop_codon:yes gene_type:complete
LGFISDILICFGFKKVVRVRSKKMPVRDSIRDNLRKVVLCIDIEVSKSLITYIIVYFYGY